MLIVIPAHNEQDTIQDVICDLNEYGFYDILVVDDASTDDTAKLAKAKGVKVMSLPYNLGAWKATQAGVRYANEQGYNGLITFDADKQHQASQLALLLKHQEASAANLVIGSCPSRGSFSRRVAWSMFRFLSGVKVTDLTSGLRLYDRNAIQVLSRQEASLLEYQDVGVLLMLKTFNISKSEIYVEMKKRESGISRIFYSWWAVIYYMGYTTMLCLSKIAKKAHLLSN
ncbi:glycosyltransferase family 2 protein [Pseudoalteromonas sp. SSM20]|uniref:glycosyltransferase family 2 protein n=1 Tax=Pseudoalteromonas sp. SSM20 TaxID=3139394 RepID=UPI003BADB665